MAFLTAARAAAKKEAGRKTRKTAAKKAAARTRPAGTPAGSSTAAETATATASPAPPPPRAGQPSAPAALTDNRGAPGWYRKTAEADPVALSNAGGGFLLGLGLWALGLAYLRGGGPEVKRLLAAKFLNRTTGSPTGAAAGAAAGRPQRVGNLPLNTSPAVGVPRLGQTVAR